MDKTKNDPKRIVINKKTVETLLLRTGVSAGMLSGGGGGPGSFPRPPVPKTS